MKKLAKILGIVFVVFLAVIIILPLVFKDDIKNAVDDAIAENVDARVFYDPDGFGLSLIPNFPNFTFSMSDFGVAGKGEFEGDTLLSVGSFEFIIDLMSVVNGDQIGINAIILDEPQINVVVLENGKANYDIAVASEEAEAPVEEAPSPEATETAAFNVSIKKWEIINGSLIYNDRSMDVYAAIRGLYHSGSGDFSQDIFDLNTKTRVNKLTTSFEGVNYLRNKQLDMEITLNMDLPNARYTFKENYIKLNNFGIGVDGFVAMPGDDIEMGLSFGGKDISIKSILSLIPGVYQDYLEGLEVGGNINFNGTARGLYNDQSLPTVMASLNIENGNIQYEEFPIPIEQINMKTALNVPGDNMNAMTFDMPLFSLSLDGEQMTSTLHFENLENYTWDFGFEGNVDLEKLFNIVPLDSMTMKGKINAVFKTSGNMALVDEERYDEIPAEGSLTVNDFYFESPDLPQGFGISQSKMEFTPKKIVLKKFNATIGKSDMKMNGGLRNFIGFALSEDQVLKGNLNFSSNQFDLNEWMSEDETTEVEDESTEEVAQDTSMIEVIRLPTNINFKLKSKIKTILYDNMEIKDLNGLITIKDGEARLDNVDFKLLDGAFVMNGGYNTVPDNPLYDFGFSIKQLSISSAYSTFNTIEKMAPVAKNMEGRFSTDLTIAGSLNEGMEPNLDDMNGAGKLLIEKATLQGDKLMTAISKVTRFEGDTLNISDTEITFEIKNGRMYVDPYTMNYMGYEATIYGSNGFDGSIDYNINTEVPTGAAGEAVNSLLAQYTGGKSVVGDKIPVAISVGGTYDDPKVGLGKSSGSGGGQSAKDTAADAARAEFEKQKKIAEEKAKAELEAQKKKAQEELERKKREAKKKAKAKLDKKKKELEKKKKEAEEKAKAEAERQKKIAEEKAKAEAEEKAKNALNSLIKK